MKFVFTSTLIVALCIFLAIGESGAKQNQPSRVEREAYQLLRFAEIRGIAQAVNLIKLIQIRARIYNREFMGLKNRVGRQLSFLVNDGRQIRAQLDIEAQKLINSLNREISLAVLKPKVMDILASLSNFTKPIKQDIADLKNAIQANAENDKCWDENKEELISFTNRILDGTRVIIMEESKKLNSQMNDVVNSINGTVSQLEEKLKTECPDGTDNSCIVNYFKQNLPDLLGEFKQFQDQVSTVINSAVDNIQSETSTSLEEVMSSDYDELKQRIKQCVE